MLKRDPVKRVLGIPEMRLYILSFCSPRTVGALAALSLFYDTAEPMLYHTIPHPNVLFYWVPGSFKSDENRFLVRSSCPSRARPPLTYHAVALEESHVTKSVETRQLPRHTRPRHF